MSIANRKQVIKQLKKELQEQDTRNCRQSESDELRIQEIMRDPFLWATEYTETYNEHWMEEGRSSPYERFPSYLYIDELFQLMRLRRILWIEKSRDMMITWACVAFFMHQAMTVPERGVLMQTQKADKAKQLIKYAKCLYRRQPQWLQDAFPLAKSIDSQPDLSLTFAHGGHIIGIPGGADQIRSYHPWGYLNDESSFQPDAGECYNEALSAVAGSIVFNSSAGPGWYADVRHDVVTNAEE